MTFSRTMKAMLSQLQCSGTRAMQAIYPSGTGNGLNLVVCYKNRCTGERVTSLIKVDLLLFKLKCLVNGYEKITRKNKARLLHFYGRL